MKNVGYRILYMDYHTCITACLGGKKLERTVPQNLMLLSMRKPFSIFSPQIFYNDVYYSYNLKME